MFCLLKALTCVWHWAGQTQVVGWICLGYEFLSAAYHQMCFSQVYHTWEEPVERHTWNSGSDVRGRYKSRCPKGLRLRDVNSHYGHALDRELLCFGGLCTGWVVILHQIMCTICCRLFFCTLVLLLVRCHSQDCDNILCDITYHTFSVTCHYSVCAINWGQADISFDCVVS